MMGLMQQRALTIGSLIDHAAHNHGTREIVGRRVDGSFEQSNWAQVSERARKIATALSQSGMQPGDRMATLAWNRLPHLELYFGVTSAGYVLNTVNPRLYAEQISYIIDHAGARIVFVEPDLLPLLEPIIDQMPSVSIVIVLCSQAELPQSSIDNLIAYDEWLASAEPLAIWPELDENSGSSLCYTSGTTGNPKGVLYSHRSTLLHAFSACTADSMALSARDNVLLVTPLFHVNAWGVPFAAAMAGSKLVLPGSALDAASVLGLLDAERISFTLGVPTVWLGLIEYLKTLPPSDVPTLELERVFMGGAATPRALIAQFRDILGVDVVQAWGMTETSPVATVCMPLRHHETLDAEQQLDLRAMQGRSVFGVENCIVSDENEMLPHDGTTTGLLKVRGHWVLNAYFGQEEGSAIDDDGWFDTGDIARISPDGFLQITDRAKDVIKSGGEWISSIDLEDAAQSHDAVAEAAVIGIPHPRWQERPLMLLRLHAGASVDKQEMLDHLAARVARWWLPDDVLIVEDLPHTGTGKLLKTALRATYGDHFGG